jgi:RNA polymerase sigma-70 factor (ECF subfamily)
MSDAQAGDRAAYCRLLKEILPIVRALVRKRIFDPVLVEDVIQDTLLTMHRVRHTFDPAYPFLPWLMALANARAIDALRARGRLVRREVSDPEAFDTFPDPFSDRHVSAVSVASDVRHWLGLLPQRQRQAVEMVKLRDVSVSDAAKASNLSIPILKSLLHRAMANLKMHKDADDE